jgi:hypothetical protein
MRRYLVYGLFLGVILVTARALNADEKTRAPSGGTALVHDVYFTLKDNSPEAKAKLVAACKRYLTNHPGEEAFAAGVRAKELTRPVNDQDFDVGLHIVFKDKESHDKYQDATRHKQFIEENQANWKQVRVFDFVAEK